MRRQLIANSGDNAENEDKDEREGGEEREMLMKTECEQQ